MRTVAALYIDPRGPYPAMEGVDCWDAERDARLYSGPHPIVAHPPCGPWGQLAHLCTKQDKTLAPLAVEQLIRWGGVLEHPANSRLFRELGLPVPGGLPQVRGGRTLWSIKVDQVRWGHACRKPTVLLFADVPMDSVRELPPDREPTHVVSNYHASAEEKARMKAAGLKVAGGAMKRRTPPLFAEWLVTLARRVSDQASVPA